ncbi:MAG: glycosyltransferase family 39 protein [bacterium]
MTHLKAFFIRNSQVPFCFCSLSILLAYLYILIHFKGNFEFTGDDGLWVFHARNAVEEKLFTLYGVVSSQGIPNSSFAVYLHSLFYWIHPSIFSIQTGVLAFIFLTHALLLRLGRELGDGLTGVFSSLLFFFAPVFFIFYNQKLWQVAYLPFFSTLSLYLAVRYVKTQKWQMLAGAYIVAGLCIGFHYSSFLMLPLILFLPVLVHDQDRPEYKHVLISVALLMFTLTPLIAWSWAMKPVLLFALVGVLALPLLCNRRGMGMGHWFHRLAVAGLPLVVLVCWAVVPGFRPLAGVEGFIDLIPAFNSYLAGHIGFPMPVFSAWFHVGGRWFSLPVAVFLAYLAYSLLRWREITAEQKLLFYWNWIPLWLLALSGLFFREYPHQWFVFLFPAPFLAIVVMLQWMIKISFPALRFSGAGILAAILGAYILTSFTFAGFVSQVGGISWHLATLDQKMEALEWIYDQGGRPKIILAANPAIPWWDYGLAGWSAAALDVRSRRAGQTDVVKQRVFYIHEPLGLAYDSSLSDKTGKLDPGSPRDFRSVRIYSFDHGVRVPGANIDNILRVKDKIKIIIRTERIIKS